MNSYDHDNINNINTFFSSVNTVYSCSDFFLRLDLIGILASVKNINIEIFIRQVWSKFFPTVVFNSDIERMCLAYYENYRFGFKIMAKGETIRKPMMVLKTLISVTILLVVDKNGTIEIELNELKDEVIEIIKPSMNDESVVINKTTEIIQQYFTSKTVLTTETIRIINQYREFVNDVFNNLQANLLGGKRDKRKRIQTTHNLVGEKIVYCENRHSTPLKYIQIVCMMYLALSEYRKNGGSREQLFEMQWPKVFGVITYDEETRKEVEELIATDSNLEALNMLFRYSLREIRSGRIVRSIIVALCVHQVLARIPHGSSEDMVIDEAITLFSRFSALSVGREEEDIEIYLKRFITVDGNVDDRVSRLLWEYADTISEFLKMSLESINSADSVRKRFWWEEMIDKKDKEVRILQNQIGATKVNTVFSLVEKLSSPTYNYVLGRLYRFSQGYDSLSENEMRIIIKTVMQVFHLFGVKAIGEELIDLKLEDSVCAGSAVTTAIVSDMESGYVVFPGWNVSGDTVILPIASEKKSSGVMSSEK